MPTDREAVDPGSAPEAHVGYLLVRIGHAFALRWTRELARFGVSARQHGVLAVLAARPGVSAGTLARDAMITPQSMGELVAGLQERGLVLREPPAGRGRPARLELTPAGRRLLEEVRPVTAASNAPATLGLSADEAETLHHLLTKVLAAVDASPVARPRDS